ncbi:hypothetical protein [Nonomuraea typhae]|uniref:hypothetical protein n=1 Tax=Nonomuraea typhae TaxID=2603600 RepID=UPI0012F97DF3|nr:hypothetical protein [Nonomuraea typhae]
MTTPGLSSWQAQHNANQNAASAAERARQAAQYSGDAARRSGGSSGVGNVIALLIVVAVLVLAGPFVLAILAQVGF